MIRLVATTMEHIDKFEPQEYQKEAWGEAKDVLTEELLENTRSLVDGEYPVAVIGAVHRWSNHWQGYTVYGMKIIEAPARYMRPFKYAIDSLFHEVGMDRLEITTPCDHPKAAKLAEFLGFKHEGRARRYGRDGGDHHVFAMVRE